MSPRLRRLLRGVRYTPERLLHPVRRRQARRRLATRPRPRRVLFICLGNICRSPYAAFAFARRIKDGTSIDVQSAGFIGPDRPSPPEAVEVAAERDVDLTPHRSVLINSTTATAADLIVVMDVGQQQRLVQAFGIPGDRILVLGDLDPQPIDRRTIRDPFDQPREIFENSYDRIDRCLLELVSVLP